MKTINEIG